MDAIHEESLDSKEALLLKNQELQKDLDNALQHMQILLEQSKHFEEEASYYRTKNSELEASIEEIAAEQRLLKEFYHKAVSEKSELRTEKNELQATFDVLNEQFHQVDLERARSKSRLMVLEDQNDMLRDEVDKLRDEIERQTHIISKMKNRSSASGGTPGSMAKRLHRTRGEKSSPMETPKKDLSQNEAIERCMSPGSLNRTQRAAAAQNVSYLLSLFGSVRGNKLLRSPLFSDEPFVDDIAFVESEGEEEEINQNLRRSTPTTTSPTSPNNRKNFKVKNRLVAVAETQRFDSSESENEDSLVHRGGYSSDDGSSSENEQNLSFEDQQTLFKQILKSAALGKARKLLSPNQNLFFATNRGKPKEEKVQQEDSTPNLEYLNLMTGSISLPPPIGKFPANIYSRRSSISTVEMQPFASLKMHFDDKKESQKSEIANQKQSEISQGLPEVSDHTSTKTTTTTRPTLSLLSLNSAENEKVDGGSVAQSAVGATDISKCGAADDVCGGDSNGSESVGKSPTCPQDHPTDFHESVVSPHGSAEPSPSHHHHHHHSVHFSLDSSQTSKMSLADELMDVACDFHANRHSTAGSGGGGGSLYSTLSTTTTTTTTTTEFYHSSTPAPSLASTPLHSSFLNSSQFSLPPAPSPSPVPPPPSASSQPFTRRRPRSFALSVTAQKAQLQSLLSMPTRTNFESAGVGSGVGVGPPASARQNSAPLFSLKFDKLLEEGRSTFQTLKRTSLKAINKNNKGLSHSDLISTSNKIIEDSIAQIGKIFPDLVPPNSGGTSRAGSSSGLPPLPPAAVAASNQEGVALPGNLRSSFAGFAAEKLTFDSPAYKTPRDRTSMGGLDLATKTLSARASFANGDDAFLAHLAEDHHMREREVVRLIRDLLLDCANQRCMINLMAEKLMADVEARDRSLQIQVKEAQLQPPPSAERKRSFVSLLSLSQGTS